ncbi:MAG TPA: hypothetical protein DCQ51_19155 [Planktothrix sp. UBA8407]|nr:hypothetical protein [Planktothrix sp. UBA8402]HAO13225.1 hypothetical protein [Planktothrix sp. UBA8407]HBK24851.1 hypothetical protein [Planktothrix sp. UBA10369]
MAFSSSIDFGLFTKTLIPDLLGQYTKFRQLIGVKIHQKNPVCGINILNFCSTPPILVNVDVIVKYRGENFFDPNFPISTPFLPVGSRLVVVG